MAKFLLALIAILTSISTYTSAQSDWVEVNTSLGFSFEMPGAVLSYDTAGSYLYTLEVDSAVVLQVHFTSEATLLTDDDPYELFAQTILYTTGGNLESIKPLGLNGYEGREIGISYEQDNNIQYLFIRIFFWDNKLLTCTIIAEEKHLPNLMSLKTPFFGSIYIR